MKKTLRRLIAGLTLTAATAAGVPLAADLTATPADTAWGAPATEPADSTGDDSGTAVTPFDTAWG